MWVSRIGSFYKEERDLKRSLALLLTSLLLVFGLAACGSDDKQQHESDSAITGGTSAGDNGTDQQEVGKDDAMNGENNAADGNDSLRDDVEQGMEDIQEGVNDAAQDAENALDGAEERARLARTRDKDGDLTDQENGFARNSLY